MVADYPCIIGSACRLPGPVLRTEELWTLFHDGNLGKCSTSPPTSRGFTGFNIPTQSDNIGMGGWLPEEGVEQYDPSFFGIPIPEAATLRPNVRLGLELTYEALQNAGIPARSLRGKNVSVHVGVGTEDGWDMTRWLTDGPGAFDANWAASSDPSGVSGRISHVFDFRGSCNTASNACASGAIALSEGMNSLIYGGAEVAIVGALATHFTPAPFAWAHSTGVASPSHRSSAFSAQADGYSPSEGAVFFVLKKHAAARAAGDPLQAIIRAVASGHNGSTRTLITPSVPAQVTVTERALAMAKLRPTDITLLEAHGTGTRVGDALEAEGIRSVFGPGRGAPLVLSSSKTVIGHCHGAAALVGVLKVIGCFANRRTPPHQVSPLPEFLSGPVVIPIDSQPLKSENLFAQVNAFGFTGTVAAAILEAPTASSFVYPPDTGPVSVPQRWLLPFSAKSKRALLSQLQTVVRWVADTRASLGDVATLLGICRDHFPEHRFAFIASSFDDLRVFLDDLAYEDLALIQPASSDIQADERITAQFLNIRSSNLSLEESAIDLLVETKSYIEAARILFNQGHTLSFEATYRKSDINPAIILAFPFYQFDRRLWWKQTINPTLPDFRPRINGKPTSEQPQVNEEDSSDQASFEGLIQMYGARISIPLFAKSSRDSTQTYLITGSNGMLGSRLLSRFLERQDITIYCVIRGDPFVRIRSAFERSKLDIAAFNDAYSQGRLRLMQTSDLCGPKLGLNDDDYAVLLSNVDYVIYLAWPVNFNLPLSAFYPFLTLTRRLAEFCYAAKKLVKLHFAGSYASTFNFPGGLVPERALVPKVSDSLSQGYAISKLVAEHSLIQIHKYDPSAFSLSIIRVGQICGDTMTGSWAPDELIPMVIASTPALKALPILFPPVAWIPSDVCADAFFEIATADGTPDLHIVHIANPSVTPWVDAAAQIGQAALGCLPKMVTFAEYVALIKEEPASLSIKRLLPYFEHLLRSTPERYALLEVVDSLHFSKSLASCPPITADFIHLIVKSVLREAVNSSNTFNPIFIFGPLANYDLPPSHNVLKRITSLAERSRKRLADISKAPGLIPHKQLKTLASQISVVEKLAAQGVKPSAVLGYSFGEYAAATISGVLTEDIAVDLLVRRAAAVGELGGAMLNVFADLKAVRTILARLSSPPSIAIITGPKHVVLSGSPNQIQGATVELQRRHIKTLDVDTSLAFHSALMDQAITRFVPPIFTTRTTGSITYISGITASSLKSQSLNVNYWLRHMREPVNFYGGMQCARRMFPGHPFIDIGPGATLSKVIGRYGWSDVTILSPEEVSSMALVSVQVEETMPPAHPIHFAISDDIHDGNMTLASMPSVYKTALHLLQELFGYQISGELLGKSLHAIGLQSLDFIRFSDYYGVKTGIHLPLSAYVSDVTLETAIAKAEKDKE